ncbi:MAG: hypothetical protein HXY24_18730 [Rubrivivax sp.]|nr:hypothetical protein [Rubrivivax sp.]
MAVGDSLHMRPVTAADPLNGVLVTRLTDDTCRCWYPYFTQPVFDAAGRLLVSSDASGEVQLHLLDAHGRMVQLTDVPGGVGGHSATILPGRGQAAYVAGRQVFRVDLETHLSEPIFEAPEGFGISILSPSGDGASVTFATCETMRTSTRTAWQYSDMRERLFRRPACVIFRVDTATGQPRALWGEHAWISHVIVSPTDSDVVVFCHEGPWELVNRLWRIRCSADLVEPLLADQPRLVRAGHEFFCADGTLAVQYSRRLTPTAVDWISYNCLLDPDGRAPRFWRYPSRMPTHFQANSTADLFVGDGAHPDAAPALDGAACLALIRHRDDERCEVTPLCRHDTSWKDQPSHPHPVFAPDDRSVYFNSDRTGRVAVYRVGVP